MENLGKHISKPTAASGAFPFRIPELARGKQAGSAVAGARHDDNGDAGCVQSMLRLCDDNGDAGCVQKSPTHACKARELDVWFKKAARKSSFDRRKAMTLPSFP